MPDGGTTIIVSGGILDAPPFTLNSILKISQVAPPTANASIMSQGGVAPDEFIVIGTVPSDATTEILQTTGAIYPSGGLTDSLAIGRGASVVGAAGGQLAIGYGVTIDALGGVLNVDNLLVGGNGTSADDGGLQGMANNVAIGFNILLRNEGAGNVLIGSGHATATQFDLNQVRIGTGSTITGGNGNTVVAIGAGTQVFFRGVAIGDRANATAADCIAIGGEVPIASGLQSIAIGRATRARATDGICIGTLAANANTTDQSSIAIGINAVTTAANQLVIGGIGTGEINEVVIGAGVAPNQSPAPTGFVLRTSNAIAGNLNVIGAPIKIFTGQGTGNAVSEGFGVDVPLIGASGTALQGLARGMEVVPSNVSGQTFLKIRRVDNSTSERVSHGATDSGGVGFRLLRIPN